jgi:hypothetical protein
MGNLTRGGFPPRGSRPARGEILFGNVTGEGQIYRGEGKGGGTKKENNLEKEEIMMDMEG